MEPSLSRGMNMCVGCVCLCEYIFVRWDGRGSQVSLFFCGGENTVSDKGAGVKWDVALWGCRRYILWVFRVWDRNTVDVSGTVTSPHTRVPTIHTHQPLCLASVSLFEMTAEPKAVQLSITQKDTDSAHLPQIKQEWNKPETHLSRPQSLPVVSLPIQPPNPPRWILLYIILRL